MHQEKLKNILVYFLIFFASFNRVEAQLWQQPSVGMELSNLHVQSIAQDSLGYIWMATARGLDRLDGYGQPHFFLNKSDNTSLSNDNVYKLFVSRNGELYVFTRWGLDLYNRLNGSFIRLKNANRNYLYSCAEQDAHGNIWLGTNFAFNLSYVDSKSNRICSLRIPQINQSVQNICCDDKGYLWIVLSRDSGVIVYNPYTRRVVAKLNNGVRQIFKGPQKHTLYGITSTSKIILINSLTGRTIGGPIYSKAKSIEKVDISADRRLYFLTDDMQLHVYDKKTKSFNTRIIEGISSIYNVTSIFLDKQSNIWIGTFEEGYKFVPLTKHFFDIDAALSNYFKNKFVTFLTGDGKDRMWIATRHDGLQEFNRHVGTDRMVLNVSMKNEESAIACCFYDSQKRLWVATVDAVFCYQTTHGTSLVGKYDMIDGARYITEDRQGNIWITCEGNGGIWMVPKGSKNTTFIKPFSSLIPFSSNVTYFMQLHSGKYLFSIFGDNVYLADLHGKIRPLFLKSEKPDATFLKSVIYIYEDSRGVLWLGTYGCGLMRYDILHHQKAIYTMKEGLPSSDILAITEDKAGHIWMSTSFGLSKVMGGNSFVNYFTKDGLLGNQYHERSVYTCHGILYFTGNHGITSFRPETIYAVHENVPLVIESLVSDDRTYIPYAGQTKKLILGYKENSFTVSFLGFDYSSAKNLRYSYMLEGYDKHWSTPTVSRIARFSNIPSGTYCLKVKVCDNEGVWSSKVVELNITVTPAPWATWWAILIYIIIITELIVLGLRFYINYRVDKEKIKMSADTLQKERELNQAKINFFENVSHELRTPLGLIYAPFCELSKEKGFSKKGSMYMSLIGTNIERLMALVEQILNFSHLDSETLSLAVNNIDVVALVCKIMERFSGENNEKNIKMSFSTTEDHLQMLVDEDKIDKILSNLLSNAFKYTPVGGKIMVSINTLSSTDIQKDYNQDTVVSSRYMQFSVKDSGIGVAKEELEKIFDRFYRSKSKSNASVVGSGIGLYYIKCLATKHKGFIKAEQNVDKGMTFKFCLPLDAVYDSSEMMNEHSDGWVDDKKMNITDQGSIDKSDEEENVGEKPQLLIVEDESNLQLFLENLLGPYYNIQKAFDGSEGLKKAFENIPDIIITDVMMPLMNGYEFCRNIKNDLRTCHIPVIMLTAKCNIEEQIEGINTGADVYISKPFHPDYLLSVLQGTIRNRRRIQHLIIDDTPPSGETEMTKNNLNKMDRELLLKLDEIMESGLSNSDLSIDDLASELNFSRSTFYRKIKTLIGISPNDYIRVYKVKRAAKLIESGDYSLSEVADMTGFSTQSYFSAMFKKHFDMTPSEYRNSKLSH